MDTEASILLLILCIGGLAYLIIRSVLTKKVKEEAARMDSIPCKVEHNAAVCEKIIVQSYSVGTMYYVVFRLESGQQIKLSTSAPIYNSLSKESVGTLKYASSHIVSFIEK